MYGISGPCSWAVCAESGGLRACWFRLVAWAAHRTAGKAGFGTKPPVVHCTQRPATNDRYMYTLRHQFAPPEQRSKTSLLTPPLTTLCAFG